MARLSLLALFLLVRIEVRLADLSHAIEHCIDEQHTPFLSLLQKSVSVQAMHTAQCKVTEPPRSNSALISAPHSNPTFKGYRDHDYSLQGLFVYPPKKLAFCLIEKNACSTWIETVFQKLLRQDHWAPWLENLLQNKGYIGIDYNVSAVSQAKFGEHGIERVFQDPGATRAVFVRDPLERFASAFLNKCINTNLYYCPVNSSVFRDVVDWALTADITTADGHFLPQAFHCDLQNRLSQYNVIGLMKEDTMSEDMNCVLAKAGLQTFAGKAPRHKNRRKTSLNTTQILQKLFTPAAALKLIDRLHYDYDLFGFSKVPDWIAGATGEWYNKDPTKELSKELAFIQEDSHIKNSGESWREEDTDDLVELVFRAGYVA